ncbi:uncharacterized protein MELLADRAFT_89607 [Melampsora larici-populina 98AG31]|uniref:NAD(P)-binding protein n=1 Tax=Melampsora larici-populina (strain 98AG31 / pathotype 3-4-7) TaxID=747676 RepID=F4RTZ1_MELLP|nr:uncharacterized protein MELLADRAFT_89607 [Melampsora larici-populina 98AG31]EGG04177.1 hypothetical protein MELLADRAFT_89607 [Melampsora larici-populina 98AG31]
MSTKVKLSNDKLNLKGKTAVISGGTQGIGKAVAIRFAQLGISQVYLIGRNSKLGESVCDQVKQIGENQNSLKSDCLFIQADLSTVETIKETVKKIENETKVDGIDYLVMSQGGPPNGLYEETKDGFDKSFAVQVLSRFGLQNGLIEKNLLRSDSTIVSILSPGSTYSNLDLNDLSLKKVYQSGVWRASFLIQQGKRDSMVTDALTLYFNRQNPSMRFYHLFPGYVETSAASNRNLPFPIPQLGNLFGPILARTIGNTPQSYSDIPIYFAANPEVKEKFQNQVCFNEKLVPIESSDWSKDHSNQESIYQKLSSFFSS